MYVVVVLLVELVGFSYPSVGRFLMPRRVASVAGASASKLEWARVAWLVVQNNPGVWALEVISAVVSVVDVASDAWVMWEFYEAGRTGWACAVLASIALSSVAYAFVYVLNMEDAHTYSPWHRVAKGAVLLPVAQGIPLWMWWAEAHDEVIDTLQEWEKKIRKPSKAQASKHATPSGSGLSAKQEQWLVESGALGRFSRLTPYRTRYSGYYAPLDGDEPADGFSTGMAKKFEDYLRRHVCFIVETIVESIPQVVLQLLATSSWILPASTLDATTAVGAVAAGAPSPVQLLSLALSMASIATKATAAGRSYTPRAAAFKVSVVVFDLFCLFFTASTLLAPADPSAVTAPLPWPLDGVNGGAPALTGLGALLLTAWVWVSVVAAGGFVCIMGLIAVHEGELQVFFFSMLALCFAGPGAALAVGGVHGGLLLIWTMDWEPTLHTYPAAAQCVPTARAAFAPLREVLGLSTMVSDRTRDVRRAVANRFTTYLHVAAGTMSCDASRTETERVPLSALAADACRSVMLHGAEYTIQRGVASVPRSYGRKASRIARAAWCSDDFDDARVAAGVPLFQVMARDCDWDNTSKATGRASLAIIAVITAFNFVPLLYIPAHVLHYGLRSLNPMQGFCLAALTAAGAVAVATAEDWWVTVQINRRLQTVGYHYPAATQMSRLRRFCIRPDVPFVLRGVVEPAALPHDVTDNVVAPFLNVAEWSDADVQHAWEAASL